MEEKKFVNYTPSEELKKSVLDDIDCYVGQYIEQVKIDIAEQQDEIIRHAIETIGGDTYRHITIDKNKVVSALEKSVKKQVKLENEDRLMFTAVCPACDSFIRNGYNPKIVPKELLGTPEELARTWGDEHKYCTHCGQALDWSPVLKLVKKED